jgi:tyrosyl-tRNA synthetase
MLHGKECLDEIHSTVQTLFSKSGSGNLESLEKIPLDAETSTLVSSAGVPVVDILIKANMAKSKGEARRFIQGKLINTNIKKQI